MASEYRLTAGSISVGSESFTEGDTVELTDAAAAAFADVLEETDSSGSDDGDGDGDGDVTASGSGGEQTTGESSQDETEDGSGYESEDADAEAETDDDSDADSEDDGALDYDGLTVPELGQKLEEKDVSDAELEHLLEYEKQNKDRTGAKKALQSHLDDGDSE